MAGQDEELVSMVDSTFRLKWKFTQEEFDSRDFKQRILSPKYTLKLGSEKSTWKIGLYPKGQNERHKNKVNVIIHLNCPGQVYHGKFYVSVKTSTGYWPTDSVKTIAAPHMNCTTSCHVNQCLTIVDGEKGSVGASGVGIEMGSTEEFRKLFVDNKICLVVTMVIYKEGLEYLKYRVATENLVDDVRSMESLDIGGEFKIVYGDKEVKCPKALLASRSSVFKSKFELDTLDKNEKEMNIDDCSEKVAKALLDFMLKGDLPENMDNVAIELIVKASYYGLEVLVQVSASSLARNLSDSVDNAAETLVLIDRYTPESPLREKVIDYIKAEGTEVVKSNHWKEFSRNYPDLVTDLFLSAVKRKDPGKKNI